MWWSTLVKIKENDPLGVLLNKKFPHVQPIPKVNYNFNQKQQTLTNLWVLASQNVLSLFKNQYILKVNCNNFNLFQLIAIITNLNMSKTDQYHSKRFHFVFPYFIQSAFIHSWLQIKSTNYSKKADWMITITTSHMYTIKK